MRSSISSLALKQMQLKELKKRGDALTLLLKKAKQVLHLQKAHHEKKIPLVERSVEQSFRVSSENMIFNDE